MKIGNWPATQSLNKIYREIRELGLESNLAELEAFGFTVIENVLSPEMVLKLRDATLRDYERRYNIKMDLENERGENLKDWKLAAFLLFKDPAFADVVLNQKSLALVTYFLGRGCILTGLTSHMKGMGGKGRALHADITGATPAPFSPYDVIVGCQYLLTDYNEEKGALAIVPGSHREARRPTPAESSLSGNDKNPNAIAIEAPAGSVVIFLGKTWHGSYPRSVPGLRVDLSAHYVRPYIAQLEDYKHNVPPGFVERHGGRNSRMAQLLGLNNWYGYGDEGIDNELFNLAEGFGRTWQG
ncbi:phytanoyl-CoA dioxygenase family protein [Bradyrhizobium sp. Pha-3]|uniref:phytanoyl-CoA dioxygenase family protein n=1 Tax=Bradyrhizobium sp. Pha-3 TaxID=208375 RepID=UPI0035D4156B